MSCTENLRKFSPEDEICAIGKAIGQRPEKGAAIAAAEFLQTNFPDRTGFSLRNVRRMRDFYKVYENDELLLRLAMKIGRTLNMVLWRQRWQEMSENGIWGRRYAVDGQKRSY